MLSGTAPYFALTKTLSNLSEISWIPAFAGMTTRYKKKPAHCVIYNAANAPGRGAILEPRTPTTRINAPGTSLD
jgi:hypothetical protein